MAAKKTSASSKPEGTVADKETGDKGVTKPAAQEEAKPEGDTGGKDDGEEVNADMSGFQSMLDQHKREVNDQIAAMRNEMAEFGGLAKRIDDLDTAFGERLSKVDAFMSERAEKGEAGDGTTKERLSRLEGQVNALSFPAGPRKS